jgi:hypothetical protein
VGVVLSLVLLCNLGICLLFFGDQLFDRRLWGSCSPTSVANRGPVESVTGVLMCGLSTSFVFAIVIRLLERDEQAELTDSPRNLRMHALTQTAGAAAQTWADKKKRK